VLIFALKGFRQSRRNFLHLSTVLGPKEAFHQNVPSLGKTTGALQAEQRTQRRDETSLEKEVEKQTAETPSLSSTNNLSEKKKKKPMNIVFFYVDDWTHKTLGKINPSVQTPNIDQMAKNGIHFNHSCVTTSICWVSRATMNTGMTLAMHRMTHIGSTSMFNETLPWNETLFPLLKQVGGYHTGFIGKWHHPSPREYMEEAFDHRRFYDGHHWVKRGGKIRGITDVNEMDAMDYLRRIRFINDYDQNKGKKKEDIIKETPETAKPFALTVSFTATHSQDGKMPFPAEYQPMKTSMSWYRNDTMPVPKTSTAQHWQDMPFFFHQPKPINEARLRWTWRYDTYEKHQITMKNYYRMATEVDHAIGRIIQELKDQGVYNNTLLVFASDNGMYHGEHQMAGKWYPHEESIRVPLVIQDPRMPESQRGTTNNDFTLNIDLAPTLLSAAGIDVPEQMQGRDIADLYMYNDNPDEPTETKNGQWRQDFFYEWNRGTISEARQHIDPHIPAVFGLIGKEYKYFHWPKDNKTHKEEDYEQLFHISVDPFEEHDIFNQTRNESAELIQKYKARYAYMKKQSQTGQKV